MIVKKPWGYEEIWAKSTNYIGKKINIFSGKRMSLQYHEKKEETILVISGELRVWSNEDDNNFLVLKKGDSYHVSPGLVHRFGCGESEEVILIEVSTPELDDVVRIKDDYGR